MKKYLIIILLFTVLTQNSYAIFGVGDIVFDPQAYGESIRQTAQGAQSISTQAQTLSQTVKSVNMAQRNLQRFTNAWSNMSSFSDLVNTVGDAGRVGNSMGRATGGFAKGLSAFTGDEYDTLSALQDNLRSVGASIDAQSTAMSNQSRGFDNMTRGLSGDNADGMVTFLEGNAALMAGIAQQNDRIGQHLQNLSQIELAKQQAEINEKKLSQQKSAKLISGIVDGISEQAAEKAHDTSKMPKYKYI